MNALIVYCHPDNQSFCHQLKDSVASGLREGGHQVDVVDLYADGFNPVMTHDEHVAYMANEPVADSHVSKYVSLLLDAQVLVFVYPTWWGTVPAMLKGWIEKVLVPGVAFTLDERNSVQPALVAVKKVVGVSTYGSPRWYVRLVTDAGRRTILRSVRSATGFRARAKWLALYGIDGSSNSTRAEFLSTVHRRFSRV